MSILLVAAGVTVDRSAVAQTEDRVRVVHLTVDSLHPDEVGDLTPNLQALRETGTWYEQGRAVMASETLPNHIAMGTGTYPGRNGIPGNDGRVTAGDDAVADPDLGIYGLRTAPSFVEVMEAQCPDLRTVTVFSKTYVWRTFSEDGADYDFADRSADIPGSGHTSELVTVPEINAQISGDGFDYLFANLGDVDRAGHIDLTGFTGTPVTRNTVLTATDTQIGTIVQALQDAGVWEETVLVISSDHSMDFSQVGVGEPATSARHADVQAALDDDARTTGRFFLGQNGGAGMIYLLDPDAADRDQVLADAREVVAAVTGVAEVLYTEPNDLDPGNDLATVHPDWNLHGTDRAGELFTYAEEGFIVDAPSGNPLPGNHGHGVTRHITSFVTGGWDGIVTQSIAPSDPGAVDVVDDTAALPEQVEQVDYAPTYGWLLGVDDPGNADGGPQWQGRVLTEAFSRQPTPVCVEAAAQVTTTTGSTTTTTSTTAPGASGTLPETGPGTSQIVLLGAGAVALLGAAALRRRAR